MSAIFKQSRELELTPQLVEAYVQRGRELRAEVIASGVRRWLAALKRLHKHTTSGGDSTGIAARA